jgi:hypothetical protein
MMLPFWFDYPTPSALESDRDRNLLALSSDRQRGVRFHGQVQKHIPTFRLTLQALGQAIWSDYRWRVPSEEAWEGEAPAEPDTLLDPLVTVHPDRIFFEAFSADQSAYGLVIFPRDLFATESEVQHGSTNIDFTVWLWDALAEMRSSRQTWLRIESEGLEVRTSGAGGRYQHKVEVPEEWVRGLLQLQEAMALPGTRLSVRPVDLLATVRFLQFNKAKLSPRALRYEFEPGQEARIVLEPWEETFVLKGTEHNYTEKRVIRTWGRRRLRLLDALLPWAERVDIYLKGRALPSFYAVKLPSATFLLGLSGWAENRWTGSGGFALLSSSERLDHSLEGPALALLRQRVTMRVSDLARELKVSQETASQVLGHLCRRGQVLYDIEERLYRHRELFAQPPAESVLFPIDPRREQARMLLEQGPTRVISCQPRETRKLRTLATPDGKVRREIVYREWQVVGQVVDQHQVEIVVNDEGRILFGKCGCSFFRDNMLNQGPCAHMVALLQVSVPQRQDLPTSTAAPVEQPSEATNLDSEDQEEYE